MKNTSMEHKPIVLEIMGSLNYSFSSMILIDSGSTHNVISTDFAKKLGLPIMRTKSCLLLLPNNESTFIDRHLVNVPISIQGVDTLADFEVWNGARYDVILGMTWLKQVDAWIACKERAVYGTLEDGEEFSIKALFEGELLSKLEGELLSEFEDELLIEF
jgi:hypothetical protein